MSVKETLNQMAKNIETNAGIVDRKIDDQLDDPDEDLKVLADQTRQLAQQVESLSVVVRKINGEEVSDE